MEKNRDRSASGSGRTLVLCFDGSSNEYDEDNTNVVKLFSLLKKDYDEQLCFYQAGVGTWFEPGVVSPVFEWCAKVLDLAFAWYLDAHVLEGYKFLMQNYRVGDKICLFGFSRGAYTARALAGFLYKTGLLPRDNESQITFAYKLYKREDQTGLALCAGFKKTYCQDVAIEFMGVWDTVSSVGVIMGRTLPFTNSNRSIKTFRHAISLDEHRVKFQPNLYHRPAPSATAAALDPEHASVVVAGSSKSASSNSSANLPDARQKKSVVRRLFTGKRKLDIVTIASPPPLDLVPLPDLREVDDVLEVWFAGCHSDVGGGAVMNSETSSLSDITLRWMVHEIVQSSCAIKFEPDALARLNIDINAETLPKDQDQDAADALEPIHDELSLNKLWWLLEVIPLISTWQDSDGVWQKSFGLHLGKGRKIVDPHPNFHPSVKSRMDSVPNYKPKAQWTQGSEVYVQ